MIQLAVCDDSPEELLKTETLIGAYCEDRGQSIRCACYGSPVNLTEEIADGRRFDIILLDVLMPVMDGIAAAREIREYDRQTKLLFLSTSPDFAVDSYSVGAYYYLLKPVEQESLFLLLDRLLEELRQEARSYILLKNKSGVVRIMLDELEYCEIIGRTVYYHLSDRRVLEQTGTMAELEQVLLARPGFAKPHRSYIVNLESIEQLRGGNVQMRSGAMIPVPRGNVLSFKNLYLSYFLERGREDAR